MHIFVINISVILMDFKIHLVIKIHQKNTDIYYKDMHTSHYIDYHIQTPWKLNIMDCIYKICSNSHEKISHIKTFISWNGYPKHVGDSISIIKQLETNRSCPRGTDDEDRKKIWLD